MKRTHQGDIPRNLQTSFHIEKLACESGRVLPNSNTAGLQYDIKKAGTSGLFDVILRASISTVSGNQSSL